MIDLILKKGKERSLLRRHPWVYDTAVHRLTGKPEVGETVRVLSAEGKALALAAYSPESSLRARCWTFDCNEEINREWFVQKIRQAIQARSSLKSRTSAIRLIFGEADQLPGLIVDQYGDYIVAQFMAAGVERYKTWIADILMQETSAKGLYERSDAQLRQREGLPLVSGVLRGEEPPAEINVVEDGVKYGVDVRNGHKTGFYIDQRESRFVAQQVAQEFKEQHGRGLRALNCFCYTGGFSLALLKGGAAEVVSVDSSAEALAIAKSNSARNGFSESRHQFVCEDVFTYLRQCHERGEHFDLVILDPPKFASNHRQVEKAARAYKDINLKGLNLLSPGGHLFTFSCSGAIDPELFQKIVAGAVFDAHVNAWAIGRFGGGADHPLLMTYPEGEYLKGLHLLVRP